MHQRRRDEGESFFLKFTAQCQSTTVVTSWQTPCGHCPTLTCLSMTSAHSCFSHPSSLKAIRCCMPVPEIRRFGILSPIPQAVIPPFDQLLESLTKTWSCFFWQLTPLEILDPSSNTSPSTSNPQAHSHLHQPNLAPPRCTLNWYASQAQEESSTWSIIIGKLHNHTSTTDNKRLTMYHINEFVFMVLPCYPNFFSLVHVLLIPTYQGTRRDFFLLFFVCFGDNISCSWLVVIQITTVYKFNHFICSLLLKNIPGINSDSVCLPGGAFVCLMWQCALPVLSPKFPLHRTMCQLLPASPLMHHITPHTPIIV